ncbi:uncharacterized protein Tco025E_07346, partial [Trypanosoma conorhini]
MQLICTGVLGAVSQTVSFSSSFTPCRRTWQGLVQAFPLPIAFNARRLGRAAGRGGLRCGLWGIAWLSMACLDRRPRWAEKNCLAGETRATAVCVVPSPSVG